MYERVKDILYDSAFYNMFCIFNIWSITCKKGIDKYIIIVTEIKFLNESIRRQILIITYLNIFRNYKFGSKYISQKLFYVEEAVIIITQIILNAA